MAKSKKKVVMPAGIRNKMMAAVSMLLVSSIMMVSSTYAWFTLSTAPEVKNISTTVAGNGSLEIALMPADGLLGSITSGFSSANNGGSVEVTTANTTWGNVITLSDSTGADYYGLSKVTLNPATLNVDENDSTKLANETSPLSLPVFGYDGRVEKVDDTITALKAYEESTFKGTGYGVRAIGEVDSSDSTKLGSTYAYAIDLAFRLNATNNSGSTSGAGKLLLQTEAKQRIYNGETTSSNTETAGSGSYMSFNANGNDFDMTTLMESIRVTFIQNYGLAGDTAADPVILGTARLDAANAEKGASETIAKLYMCSVDSTGAVTFLKDSDAVILTALEKNTAAQVTAVVWLDGTAIKNSSVSATKLNDAFAQATLNLQFSTDVTLKPAQNNALIEGSAQ